MEMSIDRRTFFSRFVIGSVTSLLSAKLCTTRVLGSLIEGPAGVLAVKISEYPALLAENGSIRLTFSGASAHPLLINRGAGDAFYAMDSDCQHNHCIVEAYDPKYVVSTEPRVEGAIHCVCHGSLYAIDGSLLGGPALRGLNTFASTFDGVDTLRVTIPGLAFSITEIAIQAPAPAMRLRLKSDILPYSTYQVQYQQKLTDPPQIIPFSKTPGGAANFSSAFTTTSPVTLYVDAAGSTGFFTVALVAGPY